MAEIYQARYWQPLDDKKVECRLCPHHCRLQPGQTGRCKARNNVDGRLIAWSYGKITSLALDPIEKKPLSFFRPGSKILSAGSFGCNFHCDFCQNWTISQQEAQWRLIGPDELVDMAVKMIPQGNIGLAFTYNEPLISMEYVQDCASLAQAKGLVNVVVTNGFADPGPWADLLPLIDAFNIDLKAWQDSFYRTICGGGIETVKQNIKSAAAVCHVEVTTLLLPGLNDSEADIDQLAAWIAGIKPNIPLHLNRHHPDYQCLDTPPISRDRKSVV